MLKVQAGLQKRDRQTLLFPLALVVVTVAVYLPVGRSGFIDFDDHEYVADNPMVQAGLTGPTVRWAFGEFYAANWHPLTWLSHAFDAQFFGPGPAAPHWHNLLLHTANVVLLFLLWWRLTGAHWRSFLVAALFAWHPLHVESVAWVSERKDVLSTFFALLTLLAYQRYATGMPQTSETEGPGAKGEKAKAGHARVWYGLALVLFAFGLMSKPMLVTLPLLLLLLDVWPLKRSQVQVNSLSGQPATGSPPHRRSATPGLILEKLPFFLLSGVSCLVTVLAQRSALMSLDHYPFGWRLLYALLAYGRYLAQMVWPAGLSFLYLPHPWPWWHFTLAAATLVGLSGLSVAQWRRRPYLLTGWLWYIAGLIPVCGLVQVGNQAMADRYSYLPLVGCFVMLAWGTADLARTAVRQRALSVLWGAVLLGCILSTSRQLNYWRSSESLFGHAIRCDPAHFVAHNLLGNVLVREKRLTEADACFLAALCLRPDYADAYVDRGYELAQAGRLAEALTNYLSALQLKPQSAGAHKNLGAFFAERGQLEEALPHFLEAVRLAPNDASAHYNLGTALLSRQRFAESAAQLALSLQLKPGDLDTRQNLGVALLGLGKPAEALPHFVAAGSRRAGDPEIHDLQGQALLMLGRSTAAAEQFQMVLRLQPDSAMALNNLAWILATDASASVRNGQEAVRLAERACSLTGQKDPRLLATLDAAYAEAGQFDAALAAARKALDLAVAGGDTPTATAARKRIELYRAGMAFHQAGGGAAVR